jgi:DNA adenine methylase
MKTPITYYSGKQQLAARIIPLIPEHNLYCEPFLGGGAIFFRKPKSKVEVINDVNSELVNFYRVVQQDFVSLEKEIMITLHSRDLQPKARVIYEILICSIPSKGLGRLGSRNQVSVRSDDPSATTSERLLRLKRKRESSPWSMPTLQDVQIECADALRIIRTGTQNKHFSTILRISRPTWVTMTLHERRLRNALETLSGIRGSSC